MLKLCTK